MVESSVLRALSEIEAGDFDKAVRSLQLACETLGRRAFLKEISRRSKDAWPDGPDSLPAYWLAIIDSVDHSYAIYNLASALWALDQRDSALDAFSQASSMGNEDADLALGEALLWHGQSEAAMAPLERAAKAGGEDSGRAEGLLGRAMLESPDPQLGRIVPLLENATRADATFAIDLARALGLQSRLNEAIETLDRLGPPADPRKWLVLGNLYEEVEELGRAKRAYQRGITLGDPFSAYNLAGVLVREGDRAGAAKWIKWAAERGDDAAIRRLQSEEWSN
jgi:Flp pilus assembly protein TadD